MFLSFFFFRLVIVNKDLLYFQIEIHSWLILLPISVSLAQGCLPGGSPRKYCSPCAVSRPSSRWIGVVPAQRVHQEVEGVATRPPHCSAITQACAEDRSPTSLGGGRRCGLGWCSLQGSPCQRGVNIVNLTFVAPTRRPFGGLPPWLGWGLSTPRAEVKLVGSVTAPQLQPLLAFHLAPIECCDPLPWHGRGREHSSWGGLPT